MDLRPSESALPVVSDRWRPSETVRISARALVVVLQRLVDLAIVAVIVVLPIGVIVVIPLWILYRFWARRRRKVGETTAGS